MEHILCFWSVVRVDTEASGDKTGLASSHSGKWQHAVLMSWDVWTGQITWSRLTCLPTSTLHQTHCLGICVLCEAIRWEKTLPSMREMWQRRALHPPEPGDLWSRVHTAQDHAHPAAPLDKSLQRVEKQKPSFLQSMIYQEALPSCQPYFMLKSTALRSMDREEAGAGQMVFVSMYKAITCSSS